MYNAEKYIAQCLESLLRQTFANFEVIIVDDCSDDKSVSIVQSFEQKFSGRLKLICFKENSGCPGIPRNAALKSARGKYITFLDSDDYFQPTALQEMYQIAEATDAEVIHAEKYFNFMDGANDKIQVATFQRGAMVNAPTIEPYDLGARIKKFTERGFLWWAQNKLIRRDLIIDNAIEFPPVSVYEDMCFTIFLTICAKKYVRIPNIFYYYRVRKDSLSHKPVSPFEILNDMIGVVKALDEFMSRREYFAQNPQVRYELLDWHCQNRLNYICIALYRDGNMLPAQVEDLFRREFFSKQKVSSAVVSYFFSALSFYRFKLYQSTEENKQLREDLTLAQLQQKINRPATENVSRALSFGQDNSLKLPTGFKLGGGSD